MIKAHSIFLVKFIHIDFRFLPTIPVDSMYGRAFSASEPQSAALHVLKLRFFLLLLLKRSFFLLLTNAKIKAFKWLKTIFSAKSVKKKIIIITVRKELVKRTTVSGRISSVFSTNDNKFNSLGARSICNKLKVYNNLRLRATYFYSADRCSGRSTTLCGES